MGRVGMRPWLWMAGAFMLTGPALYFRLVDTGASAPAQAAIFGLGIVGAAFLLAWATEVAQMDVSQALALAALAFIAVLPEYAVDGYFAWRAAEDPTYVAYATANMTGANRLLIGVGWSLAVFLVWFKFRQRSVSLDRNQRVELSFLALATVYSFVIPLKGSLSLVDSGVLVTLFGLYLWASSRAGVEEPELVGPARALGTLPTTWRRSLVVFLFGFCAAIILASAEPFAEGLVHTGRQFHIDEFLVVQWLAPLASEAPELSVVAIFALSGKGAQAVGALVASQVIQWTLLIGTLPLVYSVSLGGAGALALDSRQVAEVLLTSAQSAFALVLVAGRRLSLRDAAVLFLIFAVQLLLPDPRIRYAISAVYLLLAVALLSRDRVKRVGLASFLGYPLVGLRTGYTRLE